MARMKSWFVLKQGKALSPGADIFGFAGDGSAIVPYFFTGAGTPNWGQPPGDPNRPVYVSQALIGSPVVGGPTGQIFTSPLYDANDIADGSYGT